jgi:hypothetical protein
MLGFSASRQFQWMIPDRNPGEKENGKRGPVPKVGANIIAAWGQTKPWLPHTAAPD